MPSESTFRVFYCLCCGVRFLGQCADPDFVGLIDQAAALGVDVLVSRACPKCKRDKFCVSWTIPDKRCEHGVIVSYYVCMKCAWNKTAKQTRRR